MSRRDPQGNDIYAKRFNLAGTQLGLTIAVSTTTLLNDISPAIDCNNSGCFYIRDVESIVPDPLMPSRLYAVAHAYERSTEWHKRRPDIKV